jgi:hypothetical protein
VLNHNCHIAQEVTRKFYGWVYSDELTYNKEVDDILKDYNTPLLNS